MPQSFLNSFLAHPQSSATLARIHRQLVTYNLLLCPGRIETKSEHQPFQVGGKRAREARLKIYQGPLDIGDAPLHQTLERKLCHLLLARILI